MSKIEEFELGKFTKSEVAKLKKAGHADADATGSYSYGHYSGGSTRKLKDGKVIHCYHSAVNVDPDDGSYDTRWSEYIYSSLDDFLTHKKPISKKETTT